MQRSIVNSYELRNDFPIFRKKINGKDLVYLDNASTTQKPYTVIDSITDFYSNYNSNIHRAVYQLAEEATKMYEQSREKIANFINARDRKSTRLNSSHRTISYAVFCLKKKKYRQ